MPHPRTEPQSHRATELQRLGLTYREAEALFWVTQGKSNEEASIILGARKGTIKKHLEHIYQKLRVENRTSAAAMARDILG